MLWPIRVPAELRAGPVSLRPYQSADASSLFDSLADERVWEHMSKPAPVDAAALDAVIGSKIISDEWMTFTVRWRSRAVGVTSIVFDREVPSGAEVGGTLLAPEVWGTGLNTEIKRLLFEVIFSNDAEWVQLRTDERNVRSAAAVQKLGATEVATCDDDIRRRDGTPRRSRIFRIARP